MVHMWILLIPFSSRFTCVCLSAFEIICFLFCVLSSCLVGCLPFEGIIFFTDQRRLNLFLRVSCKVIIDQKNSETVKTVFNTPSFTDKVEA